MTGVCFCLRTAPFGYSPRPTARMVWGCNPAHAAVRQQNYGKENAMEEQEKKARSEAGSVAGQYLDSLGKSDLAALSPEEFDIFLQAIIETYRDEMTKACEPF